ncbi:hypothetical protein CcCBS67573_g08452 [Chytriomyces confervae]|uniref:Adenylate kinase n=1 Tax=Chytriomyces confervae TaxID=246404 RepID=A0A507EKB3_9FUNG|nr:hypothetical protein CcCBS67573_g08452 [Chytriomyces confervae]
MPPTLDQLPHPVHIRIVGFSGSGKSTLGQLVHQRAALFTAANYKRGFVMDGFWKSIHPIVMPQVNVIIELDYPFHVNMWRLLKRTFWRCWTKERLWEAGCQETFWRSFVCVWDVDNIFGHYLRSFWRAKVSKSDLSKARLREDWLREGWMGPTSDLVAPDQVWRGERLLIRFKHPAELEAWLNG